MVNWSGRVTGKLAGARPQEHVYPGASDLFDQIFVGGLKIPAADEDGNRVTWCAELLKVWFNAPHTKTWRAGRRLVPRMPLEPGTAIATFNENGLFPQDGIAHAAIFIRCTRNGDGIIVIDQWKERPYVQTRSLGWDYVGGSDHANYVNSAKNFSTATW